MSHALGGCSDGGAGFTPATGVGRAMHILPFGRTCGCCRKPCPVAGGADPGARCSRTDALRSAHVRRRCRRQFSLVRHGTDTTLPAMRPTVFAKTAKARPDFAVAPRSTPQCSTRLSYRGNSPSR